MTDNTIEMELVKLRDELRDLNAEVAAIDAARAQQTECAKWGIAGLIVGLLIG